MPQTNLLSSHERERLELLSCTRLLDSEANEAFDRITRLAADVFDVPMALISLIDERRQWFKSRVGLDVRETDRSTSFCSHAIQQPDVTVIEDATADARFAANPMVTGAPFVRFYAGAPLVLSTGHALGSLASSTCSRAPSTPATARAWPTWPRWSSRRSTCTSSRATSTPSPDCPIVRR